MKEVTYALPLVIAFNGLQIQPQLNFEDTLKSLPVHALFLCDHQYSWYLMPLEDTEFHNVRSNAKYSCEEAAVVANVNTIQRLIAELTHSKAYTHISTLGVSMVGSQFSEQVEGGCWWRGCDIDEYNKVSTTKLDPKRDKRNEVLRRDPTMANIVQKTKDSNLVVDYVESKYKTMLKFKSMMAMKPWKSISICFFLMKLPKHCKKIVIMKSPMNLSNNEKRCFEIKNECLQFTCRIRHHWHRAVACCLLCGVGFALGELWPCAQRVCHRAVRGAVPRHCRTCGTQQTVLSVSR